MTEDTLSVAELHPDDLLRIFGNRPGRMKLLDDSLERIRLPEHARVLEAGCSFGDGLAHVRKKTGARCRGLDIIEEYIHAASARHADLDFDWGSVYDMEYHDASFEMVFSQAAFSLLTRKDEAISEFQRILTPGGYVIINDFIAKDKISSELKDRLDFIPCFNSIGTLADYRAFFEQRGFETVLAAERYSEIISTTFHLSKAYKCSPMEMAALFARILGTGRTAEENCRCFFRKTKISYGQLIFRKR